MLIKLKILGFINLCIFFTLIPHLIKIGYNNYLTHCSYQSKAFILQFIVPFSFLLFWNLIFTVVYNHQFNFLEQFRVVKKWPWQVKDPQYWNTLKSRTIKTVTINVILSALFLILESNFERFQSSIESFPSTFEILKHVLFCALVEDATYYWIHRISHSPFLYQKFHKIHHEYHYAVTYASIYIHPVEFVLGNIIPTTLGFELLGYRTHLVTTSLFVMFRFGESVNAHCGYKFPFSPYGLLPFSSPGDLHFFHHSDNIGNFGSFFTLWDTFCGTDKLNEERAKKRDKSQ